MPLVAQLGRTLTWVAASAVLAVPFFSPGSPVSLVNVAMQEPTALTITGSVAGLQAATPGALTLTLHSASDADAVVHALTATVTDVVGCGRDDLAIRSWAGALTVPAHGTAQAVLRVELGDGVVCPGATWQLRYASS